MNNATKTIFASLKAILTNEPSALSAIAPLSSQEWAEVFRLAKAHGVVAIVLDAVSKIPKDTQPPFSIKMQWIGMADGIEKRFRFQYDTAAEFAAILQQHGIKTYVMKGLAFSTYYPTPEHRECGDLDCFLADKFDEGNTIAVEHGARNDGGDYKHFHLNFKGLTIENHRFLTNFNSTARGKQTERLLQSYIHTANRTIGDTALQMPSAEFNALFLIKHAQKHFIDEGINLRHIFDWATLLKAEQNNLDWKSLYADMEKCRINHFADILTAICCKYLGLQITNPDIATTAEHPLTEVLLADILSAQHYTPHRESPVAKAKRILRRFRRMWTFRTIADENYATLVWNTFAFSSYLNRKPNL